MIVTPEILEKYEGCNAGVEYVKQKYPDGVEAIVLINDPDVNIEYLHFGKKYLDVNAEELEAYRLRCHIDESSKFVWFSEDVENSTAVANSRRIKDSKNINDSEDIEDGFNIFNSNHVAHCMEVLGSEQLNDSNFIINSREVDESEQIIDSSKVEWSRAVLASKDIKDSSFCYRGEGLSDCHFTGFLTNCSHCLFCNGLEDKEYYVFNQKVDPNEYDMLLEQLRFELGRENCTMVTVNRANLEAADHFVYSRRLDAIFEGLSSNFYGWLGTFPHFDEYVFMTLFFRGWEEENLKKD